MRAEPPHFSIRHINRFEESFDTLEAFQRQLCWITLENLLAKERTLRVRLHIAQTGSKPLEAALNNQPKPNKFNAIDAILVSESTSS